MIYFWLGLLDSYTVNPFASGFNSIHFVPQKTDVSFVFNDVLHVIFFFFFLVFCLFGTGKTVCCRAISVSYKHHSGKMFNINRQRYKQSPIGLENMWYVLQKYVLLISVYWILQLLFLFSFFFIYLRMCFFLHLVDSINVPQILLLVYCLPNCSHRLQIWTDIWMNILLQFQLKHIWNIG